MNYWNLGNKGFAEWQTLHQVLGYLQASRGTFVYADTLMKFIHETVAELTESLDERFPEGKEDKHENNGTRNN